jgi:hypothetical protein
MSELQVPQQKVQPVTLSKCRECHGLMLLMFAAFNKKGDATKLYLCSDCERTETLMMRSSDA